MPAARYWRAVAFQMPQDADLELSRLHLMNSGARVDAAAALSASIAPSAGAVVALADDDALSTCRFSGQSVRAGGFALTWDIGAAVQVNALALQSPASTTLPESVDLLSSTDGLQWVSEGMFLAGDSDADGVVAYVLPVIFQGRLLAAAAAYSGNGAPPQTYNVAATGQTTWGGNFDSTAEIGAFSYRGISGAPSTAPNVTKTMPFVPAESWIVEARNGSWYGDYCTLDVEFLVGEIVVAAVAVRRAGEFFNGVFYGPSLAELTAAPRYGSYPQTSGVFSFTATQIVFTQNASSQNTYSFTYARDISQVTHVRISVAAQANYHSGGAATVLLRLGNNTRGNTTSVRSVRSVRCHVLCAASSVVPPHSTPFAHRLQLARDVEFGGAGTVYGTTKTKGTPNLPTKARVVLLHQRSKLPVRETWSDPVTGYFEFRGIDVNQQFLTLAEDAEGHFRPVAANRLTPEVL